MALGYSISRRAKARQGAKYIGNQAGILLSKAAKGAGGIGTTAGGAKAPGGKPVPGKGVSTPTNNPAYPDQGNDIAPWSATTPTFKTQGDFDLAAQNLAMAGLKPQLQAVDRAQATEEAAHNQRSTDLVNWWTWAADRFKKAQDAGNTAMSGLNTNNQAVNSAALSGVTDAAKLSDAAQSALASKLDAGGAGVPDSQSQALLDATLAGIQNNQNFLSTTMGGLMAGAAEASQLPAVGLPEGQADESLRNRSQLSDLSHQRSDIMANMPNALETARGQLNEQEMGKAQLLETSEQNKRDYKLAKAQLGETKANRLFQQYLSTQELSLATRKQTFDEWLQTQNVDLARDTLAATTADQAEGRRIDWANVGISQQQVDATRAGIRADIKNAKTQDAKDRAKLRAGQFNTGLQVLNSYLQPNENELAPGQKMPDTSTMTPSDAAKWAGKTPYAERSFQAAVHAMRQAGVSREIIFKILMSSQNPEWRSQAKNYRGLTKAKGRKAKKKAAAPIVKTTVKKTTQGPKIPPLKPVG